MRPARPRPGTAVAVAAGAVAAAGPTSPEASSGVGGRRTVGMCAPISHKLRAGVRRNWAASLTRVTGGSAIRSRSGHAASQDRLVAWRQLSITVRSRSGAARPAHRATAPANPGSLKGVDVQLTSSPRRALGLLAAGTIGLSTALVGVAGVAQRRPGPHPRPQRAAASRSTPPAPGDGSVMFWFNRTRAPTTGSSVPPPGSTRGLTTAPTGPATETASTASSDAVLAEDGSGSRLEASRPDQRRGVRPLGPGCQLATRTWTAPDPRAPVSVTPFKPIGAPGLPDRHRRSVVAEGQLDRTQHGGHLRSSPATRSWRTWTWPLVPRWAARPPSARPTAATTSCTAPVKAGRDVHGRGGRASTRRATAAPRRPVTSAVVPAPTVPGRRACQER